MPRTTPTRHTRSASFPVLLDSWKGKPVTDELVTYVQRLESERLARNAKRERWTQILWYSALVVCILLPIIVIQLTNVPGIL